jgi:hypothetical protein
MTEKEQLLVKLYQEMADMTQPECAACPVPLSCCGPEYCNLAAKYALKDWGVVLQPTGHPRLPFMGPNGCTVAPHLRPLCAVHTCQINALAFKPGDQEWTDRYFRLRNQIEVIEWEIHPLKIE